MELKNALPLHLTGSPSLFTYDVLQLWHGSTRQRTFASELHVVADLQVSHISGADVPSAQTVNTKMMVTEYFKEVT